MSTCFSNLAAAAGRKMAVSRNEPNVNRAIIIPPAIPGSMGDAAMVSATSAYLKKNGHNHVDLMCGKDWELDVTPDRRLAAEGFFYRDAPLQRMMLIRGLAEYSDLYFLGADVIDGAYNPKSVCARLSMLGEAARLGKKATLLGSSYNNKPELTTVRALRDLPLEVTICARDPISRARLENTLDRPVRQVADVAFLLPSRPESDESTKAIAWIENRRKAGDQIIGLNANYLHAEKDERVPGGLVKLLAVLMKSEISVVLVPHDIRSQRPDGKLLADAVAALPAAYGERFYTLPPISPGTIKAVMAKVDMLATGRMHAAILAMSSGTPAFSFAYQEKFEGLYTFLGVQDQGLLSSPTELAEKPEHVAAALLSRLRDQDQIRALIHHNLPSVLELSKENFR